MGKFIDMEASVTATLEPVFCDKKPPSENKNKEEETNGVRSNADS